MSEEEFDITTPRYFYFRSKGFESVRLEEARNTRLAAYFAFLPHSKKGAVRRPEDLYHLPGDKHTLEAIEANIASDKAYMAKVLKIAKGVDFFAGETMPQIIPEA